MHKKRASSMQRAPEPPARGACVRVVAKELSIGPLQWYGDVVGDATTTRGRRGGGQDQDDGDGDRRTTEDKDDAYHEDDQPQSSSYHQTAATLPFEDLPNPVN